MKAINCTPHDIKLIAGGVEEVFPTTENVARVKTYFDNTKHPLIKKQSYGKVEGLPEPKKGILYIVSALVLQASNRDDLIAPNTTEAIRNEKGHIIGVPNFVTK